MTEKTIGLANISVLIPTSGRFDLLRRALMSLTRSELRPSEVIVVFDSSLSDTESRIEAIRSEFVDKLENLIFIHSLGPSGAAATRNRGLSHVSSEYVAFLDDDDEFLPKKLGVQLSEMVRTQSVFSFSDYFRVSDSDLQYVDCSPKSRYKGDIAREIAFHSCRIATPTVILNSKFIKELFPLFPEHMTLREDNFAWLRVALKNGFKYVYVSEALVKVNLSGGSVQRPNNPNRRGSTPLVAPEHREILRLAKAEGLRAPSFHIIRIVLVSALVKILRSYRSKWPKKTSGNKGDIRQ